MLENKLKIEIIKITGSLSGNRLLGSNYLLFFFSYLPYHMHIYIFIRDKNSSIVLGQIRFRVCLAFIGNVKADQ